MITCSLFRSLFNLAFLVLLSGSVFTQTRPVLLPRLRTQQQKGLFAVIDTAGKLITPFRFKHIDGLWPDRFVATTEGNYFGGWDATGHNIVPEKYEQLKALPGGFWAAWHYGQCALLGPDGQPRTPFEFQKVLALPGNQVLATRENSYYFRPYDPVSGRLGPEFIAASEGESPYWRVKPKGKPVQLLDWEGRLFDMPGGYNFGQFNENLTDLLLLLDGLDEEEWFGWYDLKSGFWMKPKFAQVDWRADTLIAMSLDYSTVYKYTRDGRLLESHLVESVERPKEAPTPGRFMENGSYGLRDSAGRVIVAPAYEDILYVSPSLIIVHAKDRKGLLNIEGKWLLPLQFDTLVFCSPGAIIAKRTGQTKIYRIIDGRRIELLPYDGISEWEGIYLASLNGRFCALDENFNELLPLEYDDIHPKQILLVSRKKGREQRWYRTTKGLIETQLNQIEGAWSDRLWVGHLGNKFGLYGDDLREILPPQYNQIGVMCQPGLIAIAQNDNRAWTIGWNGLPADSFACERILHQSGAFLHFLRDGRQIWRNALTGKELNSDADQLIWWADDNRVFLAGPAGIACYDESWNKVYPFDLDELPLRCEDLYLARGKKNEHFGLFTPDSKEVLPFEYEAIGNTDNFCWQPIFWLNKDGNKGWFEPAHHWLIPAEYEEINWIGNNIMGRIEGRNTLFSLEFRQISTFESEQWPEPFGKGLFIVQKNGLAGLVDTLGRQILPFAFEYIYPSQDSTFAVVRLNEKNGVVDRTGQLILPAEFDNVAAAGPFAFSINDYSRNVTGLFDRKGRVIIAPDSVEILNVSDTTFSVRRSEHFNLVGLSGQFLSPAGFDGLYCKSGACIEKKDNFWGLITPDGHELLPNVYSMIQGSEDEQGPFLVVKGGRFGYVDAKGKKITPLKFDFADVFYANRAAVRVNGKWGYLRPDGSWAIPPRFDYAENFTWPDFHSVAWLNNHYVVIDTVGKLLHDYNAQSPEDRQLFQRQTDTHMNDTMYVFWDYPLFVIPGTKLNAAQHGLVEYCTNLSCFYLAPPYGLLNMAGQKLTDAKFKAIWVDFEPYGFIPAVTMDMKYGGLDSYGYPKIPFEYDEMRFEHLAIRELVPAKKAGKWGFLDRSGNVVIPFLYDNAWNVEKLDQPQVWIGGVHLGGKSWIIDRNGRKVRDE